MARYIPEPLPGNDFETLARWLERELQKLEETFGLVLENPMEVTHVAPTKLDTDRITFRFADGTNWNPGGGRGLYYYDPSIPAWKKVTVT